MVRWRGNGAVSRLSLVAAFMAAPMSASALVGDSDGPIGVDGSVRMIAAASKNYPLAWVTEPNPSDGFAQTVLRLTVEGHPAEMISYELHGMQAVSLSTTTPGGGAAGLFGGAAAASSYRFASGELVWGERPGDVDARLVLDRCNVKLTLPAFDLIVGRQAVTFGKAYFWNPLDVFMPFGAAQFDRDYKAGVDALRVEIPVGDFSGATLVAATGRARGEQLWDDGALLARLYTTAWEWDVSVVAGKVAGGLFVGGGASGAVSDLAVRGEAAVAWDPDRSESTEPTAVVGLGRSFESGLSLQGEYLYNGGAGDDLTLAFMKMAGGQLLHAQRHIVGLVTSYPVAALLNGSFAALVAPEDGSLLLLPTAVYSAANEVDLVAGAALAFGKRPVLAGLAPRMRSEFGTYPHFFFVETKLYF